jgi:RNA polymerase sigma factor (sigma-70 family)
MLIDERTVALVRSAQLGDDRSFAALVTAYQSLAVAYAASLIGDYHLGEDAAQEAFVDMHRSLSSLRDPRAFLAWFRTIVFKHADRITRRKRHPVAAADAADAVASPQPSPVEELEFLDISLAVREAVAMLPDAERTVAFLYYIGDRDQRDIAEFLDITPNAVKTRLYAARRRLRARLSSRFEESLRVPPSRHAGELAQRVLAATLPLQVYAVDETGVRTGVGSTAASRAVDLRAASLAVVEPRRQLDTTEWDVLFAVMREASLRGLRIEGQATDALLERISRMESLQYLALPGCSAVTDEGMRHVGKLQSLQHLDLSGTSVTDRGMLVLRELKQLQSFTCAHSQTISDAGIESLAHCARLGRVDLMGTQTGDGAIRALAALPHVHEFHAGNRTGDVGLELLSRFPALLTPAGKLPAPMPLTVKALPPGSGQTRNHLWLSLNAPVTNRGIAALAALHGLEALTLFGGSKPGPFDDRASAVTAVGLRPLESLPSLARFGCGARLCDNEAMHIVGRMPAVRWLMCQDAVAGDDGFVALSASSTIESIWGRRCFNLSGRGFASLAAMPKLRELAVSCRNVDDTGVSALPSFPSLCALMPIDVNPRGFRHIGQCDRLEVLRCMYCEDMDDAATAHLGRLELKRLGVWSTRIGDASLGTLARMSSLEEVLLYNCAGVSDAGIRSIADLPRLKEVTLEKLQGISADAAAAFPSEVRVNLLSE